MVNPKMEGTFVKTTTNVKTTTTTFYHDCSSDNIKSKPLTIKYDSGRYDLQHYVIFCKDCRLEIRMNIKFELGS